MTNSSEAFRRSAQIWLNALSAQQDGLYEAVVDQVIPEFMDAGAMTATFDDENGHLDLEATPLLGSALAIMDRMLKLLGEKGSDEAVIITELREHIDRQWGPDSPLAVYDEFMAAIEAGASCAELFAIRKRIASEHELRPAMNEALRDIGCHSSSSTRRD